MAIHCSRNIDDLYDECRSLNIPVRYGENKDYYIRELRTHHLRKRYGPNIEDWPKALRWMLIIDSPMLCKQYDKCPADVKISVFEETGWVIQEKIDGMRGLMCFFKNNSGKMEFHLYSRNISTKDYLPIDYADKIRMDGIDLSEITTECIIDCEIVCTKNEVQCQTKSAKCATQLQATTAILSSLSDVALEAQKKAPLQFVAFDCLFFEQDLTMKPLVHRIALLQFAYDQVAEAGFNVRNAPTLYMPALDYTPAKRRQYRKKFFDDIVDNGGEGIVAKRMTSLYDIKGRRTNDWIKIKRSMLKNGGLGDTIDAFVVSYNLGTEGHNRQDVVASLEVAVWLYNKDDPGTLNRHTIATVANFTEEERQQMTEIDKNGIPSLRFEYFFRVMEVDGQDISARNKRIMHAKMVRWRDDKRADDCLMDNSIINANIL